MALPLLTLLLKSLTIIGGTFLAASLAIFAKQLIYTGYMILEPVLDQIYFGIRIRDQAMTWIRK